jgi:Ca2+-binding RTX toxin-like protein
MRHLFSITEQLESRRLLSFASLSSHGTLSVVGTSSNDGIVVQFNGTKVDAIRNGVTESFNKVDVKRIWAESFGGNDSINNKTTLRSTMIGDAGNDTMTGGSADDDMTGGSGIDHYNGKGGTNTIHVGTDNDVLDYHADSAHTFTLATDLPFPELTGFKVIRGSSIDVAQGDLTPGLLVVTTPGNDNVTVNDASSKIAVNLLGGNDNLTILQGQLQIVRAGDGNDSFLVSP